MANIDLTTTAPSAADELCRGVVIPAHPLALNSERRLDEAQQRRLSRYYLSCGVGGLAVGVHTTQFAIHDPAIGLYEPVLRIAAEEMAAAERDSGRALIKVAGIVGPTPNAVREAELAAALGYEYGLVSFGGLAGYTVDELVEHCREVGRALNVVGFYLQPSVGGIDLPIEFWLKLCELDCLKAIKVAAFNRYRTLDVVRAVVETGRDDIALYTGNDDNIVADLLTPFRFHVRTQVVERRFVGGLLGQWAVGAAAAVQLLERSHRSIQENANCEELLALGAQLTDFNAAMFDAANNFRGCIAGIHEVLRRQGLLQEVICLDDHETLSAGQSEEITRVMHAYPHLLDAASGGGAQS